MAGKIKDELLHDHNNDGVDRRGFLKCMAWAGTGALCVMQGGVLKSYSLSQLSQLGGKAAGAGVAGHIHMHVLPRWVADSNFMSVVGETRILPETLDITYERIKGALKSAASP